MYVQCCWSIPLRVSKFQNEAYGILNSFQIEESQQYAVVLSEVPVFSMTDMTPASAPTDS